MGLLIDFTTEYTEFFIFFIVIQSEAKDLGNINVDVLVDASEILPPFGRLDDNERGLQIQKKLRVLCGETKKQQSWK